MSVKYKIILIVSSILLVTFILGYYFVYANFLSIIENDRLRINSEMTLKWQVKGKEIIDRYHKLVQIYEDIALNQAAFYTKDKTVLNAYNIANQGDLFDPYDESTKKARAILKNYFKDNLDGIADFSKFEKFRLHFHTKNIRSLARVWLDNWQAIVNGEKVDITDNISEFRNTIKKVIETKDFVSGIEIGKEGLVVRGVCPINNAQGEYQGSVEFLCPLSKVIKNLASGSDVNYAVYSYKKFVERLNDKELYSIIDDKYIRVSSTKNKLFSKNVTSDLLDNIANNITHSLRGDNYFTGIKIVDFSGKAVGVLLVAINVENDVIYNNKEQEKISNRVDRFKFVLAIGCVISFVFIVFLFYAFASVIVRRLEKTSNKLSESEANFKRLFMSQIDGYALHEIICDEESNPINYRFLLVNPAWEEQIGLKKEDVIGKTVLELLPKLEKFWIEKYGLVALSQSSIKFENYSSELDKYFEVYAFSPKLGQFACVSKDITQIKKDEQERLKMQDNILYAEKMRVVGQLAGGVAHDFNNKLSVIIGATELLQKKLSGTEHERMLDMIMQAAEYAADLSQKLLSFGQKNFMPFYEINILGLLNEVILLLKNKMSSNIKFEEINNASHIKINGDKAQLFSSFINIGMNACQSMIGGGVILIKLSNIELSKKDIIKYNNMIKAGFYLKIEFKDTGVGIAKENLDKIFEPFFSTRGIGSGSGLGLPAALGAIEHHGGSIYVDSIVGIGTTVTILLPCKEV